MHPGRFLLFLSLLLPGALFLASCDKSATFANAALNELKAVEQTIAAGPSLFDYSSRVADAEERIRGNLHSAEPTLRMEFERAVAWYKLAAEAWDNGGQIHGRTTQGCWAEAKVQTDWLQLYLASRPEAQRQMMAEKAQIVASGTEAQRAEAERLRTAYRNPLNKGGRPSEIFLRPRKPAATAPPPPRPVVITPAPVPRHPPVVLVEHFEAKLKFGTVKLRRGTRLEVVAHDGATVTVQYGGNQIALPASLTQPAP